VKEIQ
jgi:hypothetical protein